MEKDKKRDDIGVVGIRLWLVNFCDLEICIDTKLK